MACLFYSFEIDMRAQGYGNKVSQLASSFGGVCGSIQRWNIDGCGFLLVVVWVDDTLYAFTT